MNAHQIIGADLRRNTQKKKKKKDNSIFKSLCESKYQAQMTK